MSAKGSRGVALLTVLFFALLLTSSLTTFVRRAAVDTMIARNRDASAQAEALARGGVRLAVGLLIEDRLQEQAQGTSLDSRLDLWAQASETEIETEDGGRLRLVIEDAGTRLNLNALFDAGPEAAQHTEAFLQTLLERVIDTMPPAERIYEPEELARSLIDWIDLDDTRTGGGSENDDYQAQRPPYVAPNRPLLSVDELRLVEGFDGDLVDALRPYVTVYPFAGGRGVNLNTAPPHVLALVYYNDGVTERLAKEESIRRILALRKQEQTLCAEAAADPSCRPLSSVFDGLASADAIFPPPTESADVFTVRSEAVVGEIRRTVEAVIDRSSVRNPLVLSWRTL